MVVIIEPLFIAQLQKCSTSFQNEFRKAYQQLKVVDFPTEVKGIKNVKGEKYFFKLFIDRSRIGLELENDTIIITCFLYNQYFDITNEDL
jgi:mRNA-degrading endonuclease RelE of RelBE toxin-antitoxin system